MAMLKNQRIVEVSRVSCKVSKKQNKMILTMNIFCPERSEEQVKENLRIGEQAEESLIEKLCLTNICRLKSNQATAA